MMQEPSAPDCHKQSKSRVNTPAIRNRQDTRRLDKCVLRLVSQQPYATDKAQDAGDKREGDAREEGSSRREKSASNRREQKSASNRRAMRNRHQT
jgi:hypothetical protein